MNEEKIGVEVILTNRYSIWDGIAVAITDPINGKTKYRFYNGIGAVDVVKNLLREGLEIAKVWILSYRYSVAEDHIRLVKGLSKVAPQIKVLSIDEELDPFKGTEIPPNH